MVRYQAVLEVINDGAAVTDVARRYGVARQTVHGWLRRYGSDGARRNGVTRSAVHEWLTKYAKHGLAGLVDRVVMADPQDSEFCVLTRAESIRPDRARPDTIGPLGFSRPSRSDRSSAREAAMADKWMIRGSGYTNCNCNWGCPCQFNSPSTHGQCEAVTCGQIEEGYFNDTKLDGLNWALLLYWPGEIPQGNGREQAIIDERADADQREALRKILYGESTAPGATHFFVFNSTMSEVLDPVYAPIELSIDIDARTADLKVGDMVESAGRPIISPFSGEPSRARITLPDGFEYTTAEMGNGNTKTKGPIALDLKDSYGAFNILHMTQDGVVR